MTSEAHDTSMSAHAEYRKRLAFSNRFRAFVWTGKYDSWTQSLLRMIITGLIKLGKSYLVFILLYTVQLSLSYQTTALMPV